MTRSHWKHLHRLVVAIAIGCVGPALCMPGPAEAAARKCTWDKKTGRMICKRTSA